MPSYTKSEVPEALKASVLGPHSHVLVSRARGGTAPLLMRIVATRLRRAKALCCGILFLPIWCAAQDQGSAEQTARTKWDFGVSLGLGLGQYTSNDLFDQVSRWSLGFVVGQDLPFCVTPTSAYSGEHNMSTSSTVVDGPDPSPVVVLADVRWRHAMPTAHKVGFAHVIDIRYAQSSSSFFEANTRAARGGEGPPLYYNWSSTVVDSTWADLTTRTISLGYEFQSSFHSIILSARVAAALNHVETQAASDIFVTGVRSSAEAPHNSPPYTYLIQKNERTGHVFLNVPLELGVAYKLRIDSRQLDLGLRYSPAPSRGYAYGRLHITYWLDRLSRE